MAVRGAVFGSRQERKLFPMFHEPSRLGIEMPCLDATHRGPGCYDNHEFRTIMYDILKKPESKKGYVISARTAARFPPCHKTATPSPQKYQQDQTLSKVLPPSKTPFSSTTQRFKSKAEAVYSPGPGAYSHDTISNRKVSWPMCFGSPDWARLPQLEKRAVRMQLNCDKEFLKHRNRMAYLSLFYS